MYPLHKSLRHAPFFFSFSVVLLVFLVLSCILIIPRHRSHGKHLLFFIKNVRLLVRYLAIDVLFFGAFASAGVCLVTRCLATDMARTI
jgi:hypothetical protein